MHAPAPRCTLIFILDALDAVIIWSVGQRISRIKGLLGVSRVQKRNCRSTRNYRDDANEPSSARESRSHGIVAEVSSSSECWNNAKSRERTPSRILSTCSARLESTEASVLCPCIV